MLNNIKIRCANNDDFQSITDLLHQLNLEDNPALANFWVTELQGEIIGIVKIDEYADFIFISNLGIKQCYQKQGIARKLISEVLMNYNKTAYLYTIIPDFYVKLGFKIVQNFSGVTKDATECAECHPEKCVCMIKFPK